MPHLMTRAKFTEIWCMTGIDQAKKGEWSPQREIYETWWKGQFWGAEFET